MNHPALPKSLPTSFERMMSLLLLAMAVAFVGCSNDDEPNTSDLNGIINPIMADKIAPDIDAFFTNVQWSDFFGYRENEHLETFAGEFLAINSAAELSSHFQGQLDTPEIDFEHYTLIVGWVYVPQSNFTVENPTIENKKKYYLLKVPVIWHRDWVGFCAFTKTYYWSIFPKLSGKKIKSQVIKPY